MKISIVLISNNDDVILEFGKKKKSLIPKDILKKGSYKSMSMSFDMVTYRPDLGEPLCFFLKNKIEDDSIDSILFLVDEPYVYLLDEFSFSFFFYPFTVDKKLSGSYGNLISKSLTILLRSFDKINIQMKDSTGISLMSLPIRNFSSKDIRTVASLCKKWYKTEDFSNKLQNNVALLRKKRRPKPRTGKKAPKYIIDDNGKLFEHGYERHAQIETGDPHLFSCYSSGNFRFGKRIDARKHYNVSLPDKRISGDFLSCHDEELSFNNKTHINIFSNDYCTTHK